MEKYKKGPNEIVGDLIDWLQAACFDLAGGADEGKDEEYYDDPGVVGDLMRDRVCDAVQGNRNRMRIIWRLLLEQGHSALAGAARDWFNDNPITDTEPAIGIACGDCIEKEEDERTRILTWHSPTAGNFTWAKSCMKCGHKIQQGEKYGFPTF